MPSTEASLDPLPMHCITDWQHGTSSRDPVTLSIQYFHIHIFVDKNILKRLWCKKNLWMIMVGTYTKMSFSQPPWMCSINTVPSLSDVRTTPRAVSKPKYCQWPSLCILSRQFCLPRLQIVHGSQPVHIKFMIFSTPDLPRLASAHPQLNMTL